ncbi:hypothetical protein HK405_004358, partial [Cladochytrium tenue]
MFLQNEIPNKRYILEMHFLPGSCYPYEAPVLIFKDPEQDLALQHQLMLSLGAQRAFERWIGQPAAFMLISWLQSEEAGNVLIDPPANFTAALTDSETAFRHEVQVTEITNKTATMKLFEPFEDVDEDSDSYDDSVDDYDDRYEEDDYTMARSSSRKKN